MKDSREVLMSFLPAEVAGWKSQGQDQVFDADTIFDYIDGAGEVYRSYNFRLLLSRRYGRPGQADLVADLFDMGTSRDAFGVFTHDLDGQEASLGQGSNYKGGLLSIWRDRYFFSLYAQEETAETRKALFALGEALVEAVGRDGPKPELLGLLPEGFRRPGSVRYFHTHHVLNYHFFLATDNILNLGPETEAVLAGRSGAARSASASAGAMDRGVLLVIKYPADGEASKSFSGFLEAYMPDAGPGQGPKEDIRLVQTEDGRWSGAFARGSVVALVFQESSAEEARAVLSRVADALKAGR